MIMSMIDLDSLKKLIFEIYSAGFEDCQNGRDIVEGYNNFWNILLERVDTNVKQK